MIPRQFRQRAIKVSISSRLARGCHFLCIFYLSREVQNTRENRQVVLVIASLCHCSMHARASESFPSSRENRIWGIKQSKTMSFHTSPEPHHIHGLSAVSRLSRLPNGMYSGLCPPKPKLWKGRAKGRMDDRIRQATPNVQTELKGKVPGPPAQCSPPFSAPPPLILRDPPLPCTNPTHLFPSVPRCISKI